LLQAPTVCTPPAVNTVGDPPKSLSSTRSPPGTVYFPSLASVVGSSFTIA
jgi:hypothetical protein